MADLASVSKSPVKIITDERCVAYHRAGHPERPQRISGSVEFLRNQRDLALDWLEPSPVTDETILRAHTAEHLALVTKAEEAFDGDTPTYPDIIGHARRSVGAGLRALACARAGEPSFSLIRPPGHHATRQRAMGFCYLNSIAIAVLQAIATGAKKVAVYDFDVHHGNGTEHILRGNPNAVFYSIHQHPCYPGTGTADVAPNCFNFPVAPATPRQAYRQVLEKAMNALAREKPDLIAVSAGFDAYARDPLADETLEAEDYYWIGESFRKLGIPVFSLLEGGYSSDLPQLIFAYLKGLAGK
jgi:acetoin utilization deacetylase AcuC-like enzyme